MNQPWVPISLIAYHRLLGFRLIPNKTTGDAASESLVSVKQKRTVAFFALAILTIAVMRIEFVGIAYHELLHG